MITGRRSRRSHSVYPDWEVTAEEAFFYASPKGNGGTTYVLFARLESGG